MVFGWLRTVQLGNKQFVVQEQQLFIPCSVHLVRQVTVKAKGLPFGHFHQISLFEAHLKLTSVTNRRKGRKNSYKQLLFSLISAWSIHATEIFKTLAKSSSSGGLTLQAMADQLSAI